MNYEKYIGRLIEADLTAKLARSIRLCRSIDALKMIGGVEERISSAIPMPLPIEDENYIPSMPIHKPSFSFWEFLGFSRLDKNTDIRSSNNGRIDDDDDYYYVYDPPIARGQNIPKIPHFSNAISSKLPCSGCEGCLNRHLPPAQRLQSLFLLWLRTYRSLFRASGHCASCSSFVVPSLEEIFLICRPRRDRLGVPICKSSNGHSVTFVDEVIVAAALGSQALTHGGVADGLHRVHNAEEIRKKRVEFVAQHDRMHSKEVGYTDKDILQFKNTGTKFISPTKNNSIPTDSRRHKHPKPLFSSEMIGSHAFLQPSSHPFLHLDDGLWDSADGNIVAPGMFGILDVYTAVVMEEAQRDHANAEKQNGSSLPLPTLLLHHRIAKDFMNSFQRLIKSKKKYGEDMLFFTQVKHKISFLSKRCSACESACLCNDNQVNKNIKMPIQSGTFPPRPVPLISCLPFRGDAGIINTEAKTEQLDTIPSVVPRVALGEKKESYDLGDLRWAAFILRTALRTLNNSPNFPVSPKGSPRQFNNNTRKSVTSIHSVASPKDDDDSCLFGLNINIDGLLIPPEPSNNGDSDDLHHRRLQPLRNHSISHSPLYPDSTPPRQGLLNISSGSSQQFGYSILRKNSNLSHPESFCESSPSPAGFPPYISSASSSYHAASPVPIAVPRPLSGNPPIHPETTHHVRNISVVWAGGKLRTEGMPPLSIEAQLPFNSQHASNHKRLSSDPPLNELHATIDHQMASLSAPENSPSDSSMSRCSNPQYSNSSSPTSLCSSLSSRDSICDCCCLRCLPTSPMIDLLPPLQLQTPQVSPPPSPINNSVYKLRCDGIDDSQQVLENVSFNKNMEFKGSFEMIISGGEDSGISTPTINDNPNFTGNNINSNFHNPVISTLTGSSSNTQASLKKLPKCHSGPSILIDRFLLNVGESFKNTDNSTAIENLADPNVNKNIPEVKILSSPFSSPSSVTEQSVHSELNNTTENANSSRHPARQAHCKHPLSRQPQPLSRVVFRPSVKFHHGPPLRVSSVHLEKAKQLLQPISESDSAAFTPHIGRPLPPSAPPCDPQAVVNGGATCAIANSESFLKEVLAESLHVDRSSAASGYTKLIKKIEVPQQPALLVQNSSIHAVSSYSHVKRGNPSTIVDASVSGKHFSANSTSFSRKVDSPLKHKPYRWVRSYLSHENSSVSALRWGTDKSVYDDNYFLDKSDSERYDDNCVVSLNNNSSMEQHNILREEVDERPSVLRTPSPLASLSTPPTLNASALASSPRLTATNSRNRLANLIAAEREDCSTDVLSSTPECAVSQTCPGNLTPPRVPANGPSSLLASNPLSILMLPPPSAANAPANFTHHMVEVDEKMAESLKILDHLSASSSWKLEELQEENVKDEGDNEIRISLRSSLSSTSFSTSGSDAQKYAASSFSMNLESSINNVSISSTIDFHNNANNCNSSSLKNALNHSSESQHRKNPQAFTSLSKHSPHPPTDVVINRITPSSRHSVSSSIPASLESIAAGMSHLLTAIRLQDGNTLKAFKAAGDARGWANSFEFLSYELHALVNRIRNVNYSSKLSTQVAIYAPNGYLPVPSQPSSVLSALGLPPKKTGKLSGRPRLPLSSAVPFASGYYLLADDWNDQAKGVWGVRGGKKPVEHLESFVFDSSLRENDISNKGGISRVRASIRVTTDPKNGGYSSAAQSPNILNNSNNHNNNINNNAGTNVRLSGNRHFLLRQKVFNFNNNSMTRQNHAGSQEMSYINTHVEVPVQQVKANIKHGDNNNYSNSTNPIDSDTNSPVSRPIRPISPNSSSHKSSSRKITTRLL